MLCRRCNVKMESGVRYEKKGEIKSRKYNECPKCHERRYEDRKFQKIVSKISL